MADDSPGVPPPSGRGRELLEQRVSRLGEWILAAAFFATPMTSLRVGGSVTVGDVFLAVASLLAVVLLVLRPRLPFPSRRLWAGAGILALSVVLVQVFPPASVDELARSFQGLAYSSSLTTGGRLMIALIVLPVAVSVVVSRWSAVSLLAWAFVAGVSVSCAAAVIDAYIGTSIQTSLAENPKDVTEVLGFDPPRYVGLTGHPNILPLTAVIALPLVMARMTSLRGLLLNLPIGTLFLIAVLLSGSRGGLLGFLLAAALSLALNPRVRSVALGFDPRVLGAYALAIGVTGLLVFAVPTQYGPAKVVTGADGSGQLDTGRGDEGDVAGLNRLSPGGPATLEGDSLRLRYMEDSVEYILDRPHLGYGFEWIETSHSIYLQLVLSGGLLALIGYLTVMAAYLGEVRALRRRLTGPRLDLLTASGVSILTYLLLGAVLPDIVDRYLYLPAALVLAMSALVRYPPGTESSSSDS